MNLLYRLLFVVVLCGTMAAHGQAPRIITNDGSTNYAHSLVFPAGVTQSNASGKVFLDGFGGTGSGSATNLFTGAGSTGLVWSAAADTNKFLRGDGSWQTVNVSESDPVWASEKGGYSATNHNHDAQYLPVGTPFGGTNVWLLDNAGTITSDYLNISNASPTRLTLVLTNVAGVATYVASVAAETDPVFTAWMGTNTYVKVEADPVWGAVSNLYVKVAVLGTAAYSNATDFAWATHSHTLAGDVTGDVGTTTVGKLHGRTVDSTAPSTGYLLAWDGSKWTPIAPGSLPQPAAVTNLQVTVAAISGISTAPPDYPNVTAMRVCETTEWHAVTLVVPDWATAGTSWKVKSRYWTPGGYTGTQLVEIATSPVTNGVSFTNLTWTVAGTQAVIRAGAANEQGITSLLDIGGTNWVAGDEIGVRWRSLDQTRTNYHRFGVFRQ